MDYTKYFESDEFWACVAGSIEAEQEMMKKKIAASPGDLNLRLNYINDFYDYDMYGELAEYWDSMDAEQKKFYVDSSFKVWGAPLFLLYIPEVLSSLNFEKLLEYMKSYIGGGSPEVLRMLAEEHWQKMDETQKLQWCELINDWDIDDADFLELKKMAEEEKNRLVNTKESNDEDKRVVIKAIGIGEAGDIALERAAYGIGSNAEILACRSNSLQDAQKAISGADVLFVVVDADNKDDAAFACSLMDASKSENNLVFCAAFSNANATAALADLQKRSGALLVLPQDDEKVLHELLRGMSISLVSYDVTAGIDFHDFKNLFMDAGRVSIGIGQGTGENCTVLAARLALNKVEVEVAEKSLRAGIIFVETDRTTDFSEVMNALKIFSDWQEDAEFLWSHFPNQDVTDAAMVMLLCRAEQGERLL